jgi:formamidopyrimidine-DNA glycosylase
LPEVETTVNGIKPWLENKKIKQIRIHNDSLRWKIPSDIAKKYLDDKIVSITRRAKYILIHLDSHATLILHLGMSGSLTIVTDEKKRAKHDHFEMLMQDGTIMRYNDPRRFGCVLDTDDFLEHKLIKNLGPEPLTQEFNAADSKKLSKNKTQAIKNFIMDGKNVVGVGNIYASEALFMAGIHPNKPAGKVSMKKFEVLVDAIKQVLSQAIKAGGTTLKDFVDAQGKPGYFAQQLKVYARKDQTCVVCQAKIKQMTIGQRSTFYCSQCQK